MPHIDFLLQSANWFTYVAVRHDPLLWKCNRNFDVPSPGFAETPLINPSQLRLIQCNESRREKLFWTFNNKK